MLPNSKAFLVCCYANLFFIKLFNNSENAVKLRRVVTFILYDKLLQLYLQAGFYVTQTKKCLFELSPKKFDSNRYPPVMNFFLKGVGTFWGTVQSGGSLYGFNTKKRLKIQPFFIFEIYYFFNQYLLKNPPFLAHVQVLL